MVSRRMKQFAFHRRVDLDGILDGMDEPSAFFEGPVRGHRIPFVVLRTQRTATMMNPEHEFLTRLPHKYCFTFVNVSSDGMLTKAGLGIHTQRSPSQRVFCLVVPSCLRLCSFLWAAARTSDERAAQSQFLNCRPRGAEGKTWPQTRASLHWMTKPIL